MDRRDYPPELQAIIDAMGSKNFSSLEDANRFIGKRMREYDTRTQADLGGLSPEQLSILLSGDWETTGGIRIESSLPLDDLRGSALLADARTLLSYVRDNTPVKATEAGNLSRAVVAELLPRLELAHSPESAWAHGFPAPKNEGDVRWLPDLRFALEAAGLIGRRKGFIITRRGRELLAEVRAGEFFSLLFRTYFRRIDLESLDHFGGHAGLQPTVAFSFYILRRAATTWTAPDALAEKAWLIDSRDPPRQYEIEQPSLRHWPFTRRVLRPLVAFGLLEERSIPSTEPRRDDVEIRKTPLYDKFMQFYFGPSAA